MGLRNDVARRSHHLVYARLQTRCKAHNRQTSAVDFASWGKVYRASAEGFASTKVSATIECTGGAKSNCYSVDARDMADSWLRTNRRFFGILTAVGLVLVVFGVGLLAVPSLLWLTVAGVICGIGIVSASLRYVFRPVIAYEAGFLLLRLTFRQPPIRVPLAVVEGFLLGQGPSYLPGKQAARLDTSTLVLKLAERAEEWERHETNDKLASWCGHYVTIRGTWCEPLTLDLVNRLNQKLYDATRAESAARSATSSRATESAPANGTPTANDSHAARQTTGAA
jgi:hypothetical protein